MAARVPGVLVTVGLLVVAALVGAGCGGRTRLDSAMPDAAPILTGEGGAAQGGAGAGAGAGGGGGAAGGASGGGGDTGTGGAGGSRVITIPCGLMSCQPGEQCCVQTGPGGLSFGCGTPGAACESGIAVGCLGPTTCADGNVCCLGNPQRPSTICTSVFGCLLTPGVVVCGADSDCNLLTPHCCPLTMLPTLRPFGYCSPSECGATPGPCNVALCPGPLCMACPRG